MGRWEPNAAERLTSAGLELFERHGYEQTTVADIAAAAGLTERTFFRHFTDKREVLFGGASTLVERLAEAVVEAPAGATPYEAVRRALARAAELFDGRREHARRRQHVLDTNQVLAERELAKMATLADALAAALQARDVDVAEARLTAEVAVLVFRVGFGRWLGCERPLDAVLDETYAQLGALHAAA